MNFKQIFKEMYPKFRAYAYSKVGDLSSADDLVMEVFKKLIEGADSIPSGVNVEAYFMRAIKNQFLDSLKKDKYLDPMENSTEQVLVETGSEARVFADANLDSLIHKLDRLGERCKNILSLFGLGYSYKEISEIEELAIGTVMSSLSRCRENLVMDYQE